MRRFEQGGRIPFSPDLPDDGGPTAAEIFRVFRETTIASISGLKLLLDECADLRTELVTIVDGNYRADGLFSARQRLRILELREAALEMEALLATLPGEGESIGATVMRPDSRVNLRDLA